GSAGSRYRCRRVMIERMMRNISRRLFISSGAGVIAGGAARSGFAAGVQEKPLKTPLADARKPNIVLILTDNVGYGELGVYGGGILRGAPTLRIDKLAGEGLRLLNFNVEAQCTPSRSALMTGRFP